MTHSPPGTAGPGGRAAAISDVSNRGDAESGDVSSREEVHGRVTSGAGSSGDDRSRADGSADKVVATTVGDVSGKKSATHSGPRGGLRASMQVLQRELAHMHASSNWATSRLVLGSAGSPETVGSDRQTSAREDNSGVGWMDAARVRLDSEGNVPADHFLGGRDGFGPNQNQSQGGVARTGDLGRGASSSNDELVTDRKCDPGISGRSPCFEAEKIPVGAPERQSLADFLALEVQADRMAGREAFLKQRALSAANERRRLTEARKRPGSGDSIPECVEVAEEGSGGEEGRGPERRLSVFTPPEKEGQRNGAEKQTLEPVRRGEVTERGAANDNGEGMEWRNRAESAAPGICDTGNAEGKSGTNKRGDSGLAESGREKGGEKGDLTARLAAEVAALKARLAAKDAEIMRIRRAERPSEAAVSTSGRNAKTSMPEHNPIIKRIPIAGDAEAEAERKSQTEAEAEAEVELAAKSEAATRSEGRGGETGFPEAESAPSGRNGVRERKKEAEYKAEKRAVVRGGSLAWEFVPPERGSAVDLPVAVRNDSGHVMDLQAESEAFSTVQSDPFYPRARTDESRLQTPAATRGRVENRAAGGEPKRGVLTTDWNLTEVTCAPNREVSQDSLCPPRGAPAEISDVSGPHVARPGAMQGFSTRHVPRPNSVRDGSLDVPRPVLSNARHRDILGFPGAEPRPEAFSQPEPSVSNRVSFAVERETRPESFLQGPRVPYALPGESGISAVRVWEAFQMSRHQTPSGRRHSDVTPSLATAYGQRPAYEPIAPQRRHSGNPVMTSAAATGGVHRPPTALSLEEQSILASLQRLDLKLRGMAESSQGVF